MDFHLCRKAHSFPQSSYGKHDTPQFPNVSNKTTEKTRIYSEEKKYTELFKHALFTINKPNNSTSFMLGL